MSFYGQCCFIAKIHLKSYSMAFYGNYSKKYSNIALLLEKKHASNVVLLLERNIRTYKVE